MLDKVYDKIKYLVSKKGIKNSISNNFGKMKMDSYNSLPIKNILNFHIVIILIKSVLNKNKKETTTIYC